MEMPCPLGIIQIVIIGLSCFLCYGKANAEPPYSICNPKSMRLFPKFLLSQWLQAKAILNISSSMDLSSTTLREINDVLLTYNLFMPSIRIFYSVSGLSIPYATLWKCASEGITRNLNSLTCSRRATNCPFGQDVPSKESAKAVLEAVHRDCSGGRVCA